MAPGPPLSPKWNRGSKKGDKIGAKSGHFQREIVIIPQNGPKIINFTLNNKQNYVLRFYMFMKKITIRSVLGANFPFAPNSEHCSENWAEWRPWPATIWYAVREIIGLCLLVVCLLANLHTIPAANTSKTTSIAAKSEPVPPCRGPAAGRLSVNLRMIPLHKYSRYRHGHTLYA